MMLLSNLRTSVGLVNGALGFVVAVSLKESAGTVEDDLPKAISASHIRYVVLDISTYTGPCFFEEHPTWVPIRPITARHRKMKQWTRTQLPITLAWGMTVHKSQGLTFPLEIVVDFSHQ